MHPFPKRATRSSAGGWKVRRPLRVCAVLLLVGALNGCAALSNPVANGIPVRRLPPELLGESRENLQTIPLTLLRQPPPKAYLLDAGDVLGVWVEGVLGEKGQPPPVRFSELGNAPPTLGLPMPVRDDGTIVLPYVPPIRVKGMTLEEAQEAIRRAYTVDRQILKPGQERILLTLQQRRQYHILVIREDAATNETTPTTTTGGRGVGFNLSFGGGGPGTRRGAGYSLDLPAYENDVLNALAQTGGFPGTDAVNEVLIYRGSFTGEKDGAELLRTLPSCPPGGLALGGAGARVIRIPLRLRPGETPQFTPEDIILQTGDIVRIEARKADVFYAGGLLPSGEYPLPRDTDLDVVEAITRIGGPINSGGLNTLNISGTILTPGIGASSPSLVSVVRRTPDGGQFTIRVDLNRALRDPRERILIQPKDLILLQETPEEAFARYISGVFHYDLTYTFLNSSHALGSTGVTQSSIAP